MALLRAPHHPLDAWIAAKGQTREWAARHLKTTNASLSRIINGKQWPGPEFFQRVESLTEGQVTADHFVNPKQPAKRQGSPPEPSNTTVRRNGGRETVRVNVRIDKAILAEAADLGIEINALAEDILRERIGQEKIKRWQAEHADVIGWYNDHVEKDGIFGEEWRTF